MYKYIHDQSVNLMNKGYTGIEISNMVKLPPELDKQWYNRGYYGTVKHNTRAVYQRYMGFYDANPSTLDQLPPEEAGKKYVEYMGGAAAVLQKAKTDFDKGEYRWVAEALKHVVFADPNNREGKELLADTYEQMLEKHPTRAVEKAIRGMLPRNSLGRQQLSKLKVYAGDTHPHAAQQPVPYTISQVAQ